MERAVDWIFSHSDEMETDSAEPAEVRAQFRDGSESKNCLLFKRSFIEKCSWKSLYSFLEVHNCLQYILLINCLKLVHIILHHLFKKNIVIF